MLPVGFFWYHSHGYWRRGCTTCRDGGGNQSKITKYLNQIVEHSKYFDGQVQVQVQVLH